MCTIRDNQQFGNIAGRGGRRPEHRLVRQGEDGDSVCVCETLGV